jgi:glycosyltransferase involved in cell wall biosynthesis
LLYRCPKVVRRLLIPGPQAPDFPYQLWLLANHPSRRRLRRMRRESAGLPYHPVVSVVTPVFDPALPFLRRAIESVRGQAYPYWELCLVDDGSRSPGVQELIQAAAAADPRIKTKRLPLRAGIAEATNHGLAMATGEFVAFLDHDDTITPNALYEVARCLSAHPDADMLYSDEDKVDEHGTRSGPFFKPAWCSDSFLSRMYTSHLLVLRRSLVLSLGGCRKNFEGGQTWDLVLRLTETTQRIHHIPTVLYQWRVHPGSTAMDADQKPWAYEAYKRAVEAALVRRGEPGRVLEVPEIKGFYIVRYEILRPGRVSVVLNLEESGAGLDRCLESIFTKTHYPDYEVVLPQNATPEPAAAEVIRRWRHQEPQRFRITSPTAGSAGGVWAELARGPYVLLLSSATTVLDDDWMTAMVEQAQRPSIGAVGALLLDPDGSIHHAGTILGRGAEVGHSHRGEPATTVGYAGQVVAVSNYLAVSGACLMGRRELFVELGPSVDAFADEHWDIELCLTLFERGYWNVYLPHVRLHLHPPSADTRGRRAASAAPGRWPKYEHYDPCYSPHLTRRHEDFRMRLEVRGHVLAP